MRRALSYRRFLSTQVFTHAVPFSDSPSVTATLSIIDGKHPSRPTHPTLTEDLWTLVQCYWYQDPTSRPKILEVSKVLILPLRKRLISNTVGTEERICLIARIFSEVSSRTTIRSSGRTCLWGRCPDPY